MLFRSILSFPSHDTQDEKEDSEKIVTFEDVETNEKLLDKYSKNEKALYWKWKNDKRKRQDAVAKVDELKAELELKQVKDNLSNTKLKKIRRGLQRWQKLTLFCTGWLQVWRRLSKLSKEKIDELGRSVMPSSGLKLPFLDVLREVEK